MSHQELVRESRKLDAAVGTLPDSREPDCDCVEVVPPSCAVGQAIVLMGHGSGNGGGRAPGGPPDSPKEERPVAAEINGFRAHQELAVAAAQDRK